MAKIQIVKEFGILILAIVILFYFIFQRDSINIRINRKMCRSDVSNVDIRDRSNGDRMTGLE